jgi:hypothetical protein
VNPDSCIEGVSKLDITFSIYDIHTYHSSCHNEWINTGLETPAARALHAVSDSGCSGIPRLAHAAVPRACKCSWTTIRSVVSANARTRASEFTTERYQQRLLYAMNALD